MKVITFVLALAVYSPLHAQQSLLDDVKTIHIYANVDPRIYPDAHSITWKAKEAQILFRNYVPFSELDQDTVPSYLSNAASYFSDSNFDGLESRLFFLLERKRNPDLLLEMMFGDPYLIRLADDHEEMWVLNGLVAKPNYSSLSEYRGLIKEILYDFRDLKIESQHEFSPPMSSPKPIAFDPEKENELGEQYAAFMKEFPLYEDGAIEPLAHPQQVQGEMHFFHLLMNLHGYWYQLFENYSSLQRLVKNEIEASARWLCEQGHPRMVRWRSPYAYRINNHSSGPPSNPIHFRLIEIKSFNYQIGRDLEYSALVCPLFNQATEAYIIEKYGETRAREYIYE